MTTMEVASFFGNPFAKVPSTATTMTPTLMIYPKLFYSFSIRSGSSVSEKVAASEKSIYQFLNLNRIVLLEVYMIPAPYCFHAPYHPLQTSTTNAACNMYQQSTKDQPSDTPNHYLAALHDNQTYNIDKDTLITCSPIHWPSKSPPSDPQATKPRSSVNRNKISSTSGMTLSSSAVCSPLVVVSMARAMRRSPASPSVLAKNDCRGGVGLLVARRSSNSCWGTAQQIDT